MPVVTTAPPPDPTALARALSAGPFAAIVVASPRAAAELARAAGEVEIANWNFPRNAGISESLEGVRTSITNVWAVGPATGRALANANLAAHHPAGVRNGAELARALVEAVPVAGQRVLVPRAAEGRTDAIEILRDAGADVVDVIAYRTVPRAADDPAIARGLAVLRAGEAEICAVFAPSQVAALVALVGPLAKIATRFCAIGETTAAALRAAGVRSVAVASTPTPDGLATAVMLAENS